MIKSEPTTHIRIKITTKELLDGLKIKRDTHDDVVQKLLIYYHVPPEAIE